MAPQFEQHLSRRERQIMDIVYARGAVTAAEVQAALPKAPSYSATRTLLRILEEKGHLKHREEGPRYVYVPVQSRNDASRSALKRVVQTFFEGSRASAVAALVDPQAGRMTPAEIKRIETIIRQAKAKRR
jgi:BlaI family penicillinase repressor